MKKNETITGLFKLPGSPIETRTVPNTLEALQELVGGRIETLTFSTDCMFICNREGKLLNLPANFYFCGDIFVGPVFICGRSGEHFVDLSISDNAEKFLRASICCTDCFGRPYTV